MHLIKLSAIIILVISALALTQSAVILTEDYKLKAPEENTNDQRLSTTTQKEQENYITATKLQVESDASWFIIIGGLFG